jgi:hypothetical protein
VPKGGHSATAKIDYPLTFGATVKKKEISHHGGMAPGICEPLKETPNLIRKLSQNSYQAALLYDLPHDKDVENNP